VMLAEKAADLIRGNSPVPPSNAKFYRHSRGDPSASAAARGTQIS
jgi:hypothetical protein